MESLPDTSNLREYDDAMDAAAFMRSQAQALMENAAQIEFDAKKKAVEYVGEQDPRNGPLLPLRHRLMVKELGYNVGLDGPSPNVR